MQDEFLRWTILHRSWEPVAEFFLALVILFSFMVLYDGCSSLVNFSGTFTYMLNKVIEWCYFNHHIIQRVSYTYYAYCTFSIDSNKLLRRLHCQCWSLLQPYRRDPDIARFQTSQRAGRRNAVTQEDLLTVAAKYSSQPAADSVTETTSDSASSSQTTETRVASLPADLSKLKFGGKDLNICLDVIWLCQAKIWLKYSFVMPALSYYSVTVVQNILNC